jgi:hypothetical protein
MKNLVFTYALSIALFGAGCSKLSDSSTGNPLIQESGLQKSTATILDDPSACDGHKPLGRESADVLKGTWNGITIKVSSPTYRVYCDNGYTVVVTNGTPFWGQLSVDYSQNTQVLEYPGPNSNTFVIVQGTLQTADINAYNEGIRRFRTAWQAWTNNPGSPMPSVDAFIPKGGGGIRNITGKLIRVTDGTGFAVAPACHSYRLVCEDRGPTNAKGYFYHVWDDDIATKVWVVVDPNNPSVVVAGKVGTNNTLYPATGTYIASPRSVSNFTITNSHIGPINYTGNLSW